jgi:acyl carrier protein
LDPVPERIQGEKKLYRCKKIEVMEREDILKEMNLVFIDILDNDEIKLSSLTTAGDVEGWDSLTHIQLVVAIEKHFKIRFTSKEIQSWKNIGEMVDCIDSRLKLS